MQVYCVEMPSNWTMRNKFMIDEIVFAAPVFPYGEHYVSIIRGKTVGRLYFYISATFTK